MGQSGIYSSNDVKALPNFVGFGSYFEAYKGALDTVLTSSCALFQELGISIRDHDLVKTYQERDFDNDILRAIFEKLCMMRDCDPPLKVLEVGAGVTLSTRDEYGKILDESSPWMSRALKLAFPNLIDLTVSDIQSESFQYLMLLTKVGSYDTHCNFTPPLPPNFNPYSDFWPQFERGSIEKLLQSSETAHGLRKAVNELGLCNWGLEELIDRYVALQRSGDSDLKVRIIPVMQPVIEQKYFGIKTLAGVDMRRLGEIDLSDGVDFVFGRHLYPVSSQEQILLTSEVQQGLSKILRPGGTGFLAFDNVNNKVLRYEKPIALPTTAF